MTNTRPAQRIVLAAITAATLALTACGGDSDEAGGEPTDSAAAATQDASSEPAAEPTDDQAAALEQAVRDYTAAYFEPDTDAAYDMLSARCQDSVDQTVYASVVEQAVADYGQLGVESFAVDDLAGEMARVTYTVGLPLLDEQLAGQPWLLEDGEWRYDAC